MTFFQFETNKIHINQGVFFGFFKTFLKNLVIIYKAHTIKILYIYCFLFTKMSM